MEKSTACSTVKKNEQETSNGLRDEVLKSGTDNELRDEVLKEKSYKITRKWIEEKANRLPKLMIGEHVIELEVNLTDEFKEKARNELRETPEIVAASLAEIKEMMKGDPDLIIPDYDEVYMKFLRPCKWYPKSAFHLMQRYYRFRLNYPHVVQNLTPVHEMKILCSGLQVPFPKRCKHGCRLLVVRGGSKWNPKEFSLNDVFRNVVLILEAALLEPHTQISGVQVIFDMENMPFSHITHFTPRFAAMVAEWVQRCLPCRLKNIHIVNQPFIFNMIFAIFKPFLSEKLRKRIRFHGTNRQELLEIIGPEALWTKYGGDLVIEDEEFSKRFAGYICNFEEEFEAALQYGYVSKK